MTVTYSSYLRLDQLLALQTPRSGELEHDETLFVIIHQIYELWFKEVLHELDYLMRMLRGNDTPLAAATLKRILTILRTVVAQIAVLETMTPLNFLAFRDRHMDLAIDAALMPVVVDADIHRRAHQKSPRIGDRMHRAILFQADIGGMKQVFGIAAAACPFRNAFQNPCPEFPVVRNFCHSCFPLRSN